MKTYSLHLPLSVPITEKKNFSLNLNVYRNAHFYELNKAKEVFHKYIGQILGGIPPMNRVIIHYTLFFGSKRRVDIANICSIIDKFLCDTLTENKILPDDSYEVVQQVSYSFGGIDKENPRVEALIIDLDSYTDQKENPMRITLVQAEIEQALTNYLKDKILIADNQHLKIDFKATRGEEGYLAEIELENRKNPLENTSESVKSTADLTAKDVFAPPNGTALQIENSHQQQQAAEQPRTEAPVVQAVETPPQTTEPVQSPSPAAPASNTQPQAQNAPTAVPASETRPLFGNLTPPVNSAPKTE